MNGNATMNSVDLSPWTSFLLAATIPLVWYLFLSRAPPRSQRKGSGLYARDHGKLNISLPPETMWMNMGFWKDTTDFPTACCALLQEVLKKAGLLLNSSIGFERDQYCTCTIFDLGFGYGDQTLFFHNAMKRQLQSGSYGQWRSNLQAYVGITLDPDQFRLCQQRLGNDSIIEAAKFQTYCSDAGRPESWPESLIDALGAACSSSMGSKAHENWVLGLDTLYHFQPSRWHVIKYAKETFDASLMAFDLCVAENTTLWQRFILRLLAWGASSPYRNWVTIAEYMDHLVAAGYSRERIEIHDISEHVFEPLTNFLKIREQQLKDNDLSIGRFRYAALMFNWWARSNIVIGCIIIARKSKSIHTLY